jgi:hypothetical protein
MAHWLATSWWPAAIAMLGGALVIALVLLHYRRRRRPSLLFILAGLALFIVDFALETIVRTYDSRTLPNGMLELIPRPWKAVGEGTVVIGHACIFLGLLAEALPSFARYMERQLARIKPRVPDA